MADSPLPTDAAASSLSKPNAPRVPASPGSLAAVTRRVLLGGVIAAPIIAASPAVAAAHDRGEWEALVAAFRQAEAEQERLGILHDAIFDLWLQQPAGGKPVEPATPDLDVSRPFREFIAAGRTPEHRTAWASYEAALAEWEAGQKAAKAAFTGESEAHYSDALDARAKALSDVTQYPVPTLALLAEKAAILQAFYGDAGLDGADAEGLIADIQRLASQGAR